VKRRNTARTPTEFLDERSREEKTYSLTEIKKHLALD
jgi:hypothetical protein